MYRLLITTILYLLVSVYYAQAQEDIVLRINGKPVYKSEFASEYRKSNSVSVKEYLPLFISKKIRLMDIHDRGIDTLTSFKLLYAQYKGERKKSELINRYKQNRDVYANCRFVDNGWIKYQSIEKYIPQNSSNFLIEKKKRSCDSIYNALKSGADFSALSIACSDDRNGASVRWERKNTLPQELLAKLSMLNGIGLLPPVVTASGIYIVNILDSSPNVPSEMIEGEACRYVENRDNTLLFTNDNSYNQQELLDDFVYQLSLGKESVSQEVTEGEIEYYYRHHTSDYYYDEPHFKGAAVYCSSKKMGKVIKKYLKKRDYATWQSAVNELTHDDNQVRMEMGIFKRGDNQTIDKMVFKSGADVKQPPSLPYVFTIGKLLKKKPDSLDDVRESVKADLLNSKIMRQNSELMDKYRVEIDEEVLKTVNNSGSN